MNYFQNNADPNDIQLLDPSEKTGSRSIKKRNYDKEHQERMTIEVSNFDLFEYEDR